MVRLGFAFIVLALASQSMAYEVAMSPYNSLGEVDAFGLTEERVYLFEFDHRPAEPGAESKYVVHIIDRSNHSVIATVESAREMFADGGSREFRFSFQGKDVLVEIPFTTNAEGNPVMKNNGSVSLDGKKQAFLFSSLFPLEETSQRHLLELFKAVDPSRTEVPILDTKTIEAPTPLGICSRLRAAVGRLTGYGR